MVAGFGTAIIAGLLHDEHFKDFGWGRIALIVLPTLGSLASTFLVQIRVRELLGLRERGRQDIQHLIGAAEARFAAVSSPSEYSEGLLRARSEEADTASPGEMIFRPHCP